MTPDLTASSADSWITPPSPSATVQDVAAVRGAVLDYFEGWYDADPQRMRRALHPNLVKRSWAQDRDRTAAVESLSAEQMIAWTAAGHGRRDATSDRAVDIDVVDVSGPMATVVARAAAYVEYLHLVYTLDGWRIINVMWRYADGHGSTR